MKQISSKAVCDFFYVFFVIYAILFAFSVVAAIATLFNMKKLGAGGFFMAIQGLIITAIPGIMMMFYYIICDRALLAGQAETSGKVNQMMA